MNKNQNPSQRPDNPASTQAQESLSRGWHLQQEGRLEQAASHYQTALRHEPKNANAMHLLGLVTHLLGDSEGACNLIRGALGLRPNDVAYHVNLAMILDSLGRFEEAMTHNRKAVELNPQHIAARFSLANELRLTGELDQAIIAYGHVLSLAPDRGDIWSNYGSTLEANGNHQEAVAALSKATELSPDQTGIWSNLGNALRSCQRTDEAVVAFEKALALSPQNPDALTNLGLAYLHKGNLRKGQASFERCLDTEPGNRSALAFKSLVDTSLGKTDLLDYEKSIYSVLVSPPGEFASVVDLNRALSNDVVQHETLKWEPVGKSTYGGYQSSNLLSNASPAILALSQFIQTALQAYLDSPPLAPNHPYQEKRIDAYDLNIWATVLHNGQQQPHIHPGGWLSGVYYVQIPDGLNDDEGWIEFGYPPMEIAQHFPNPKLHRLRPTEGELLIFPSYFFHRTLPFASEDARISIAFDLIPNE